MKSMVDIPSFSATGEESGDNNMISMRNSADRNNIGHFNK